MKLYILPAILVLLIAAACNNDDNKHAGHNGSGKEPQTLADSLMKDIDDGHIVGMSKMGKLHNTKKEVQRIIDSIGKLPAKAQAAVAPYVDQLKENIKELEYADFAMEKWMTEFEMDSAIDNLEQRIKYLTDEKMKVGKMKEAILTSMQKADSLLKVRF
ncbi:MAG: viral A-type inclusion protein [Chitinophagaceae bacterium]|jgi:hypothetical protein|nr:viral A-type inclusion protein [Chitinophagaceae bacterium]MBK7677845.1 viral A-type inclusion protein [Chitinophagaceae bacterium]MBK8300325.1 viral A-type inclusion protein [Chitinophagaceae bacterium]MBK9464364.1 viral A-type inclusion protein [Chitinophagaceae bacterium]MBK9658510.1 viral A-type inclusion protein [Chitinophagaceae bacterium]